MKKQREARQAVRLRERQTARGTARQGKNRMVAFVLIATAVLALALALLKPVMLPPRAIPGTGVIELMADMGGFSERVIRVKVGETVTVRLTSLDSPFHLDGGGKHQFAIEELGVNIIAPARGTASATFTPAEPGTYVFYCDICCGGRANPTMNGRFIVEA